MAIREVAAELLPLALAAAAGTLDDAGWEALKRARAGAGRAAGRAHPEGNDGAAADARRPARRGRRPRARVRLRGGLTPDRPSDKRSMDAASASVTIRPLAARGSRRRRRDRRGHRGPAAPRLLRAAAGGRAAGAQAARAVRGTDDEGLAGYILARVLEGEFGRSEPGLRLEVDRRARRRAEASASARGLFDALSDYGRRHGMAEVRTQAAWNDHAMLRWLDAMGFTLAPNHVVDCAVAAANTRRSATIRVACPARRGAGARDQLRRAGGQRLRAAGARQRDGRARWTGPTSPRSCASTARITGRDRQDYMQHQLVEAMHGVGDPRLADRAARRRNRRIPDGAGGPGRLRPHRAGGRHRHHRRRSRLRPSRRRPRARCRSCSSISARCASSASRPWSRRAISRLLGFLYDVGFASVAAAAVRAAARLDGPLRA